MFSRVFRLNNFSLWNFLIWLLMAFQAGAINTGAYLGCHRFVSHVTGFATLVGTATAEQKYFEAMNMALIPVFFLLGTMISAYLVDRRLALRKKPLYTLIIVTIAGLMYLAAIGGDIGLFGPFHTPTDTSPNILILSILCLTCGLQNASISSASGTIVRTTHLTGITTDLGIGLMKIFSGSSLIDKTALLLERRATAMRVGIIGAFTGGSIISAIVFNQHGYNGYLLPAAISSFLLVLSLRESPRKEAAP